MHREAKRGGVNAVAFNQHLALLELAAIFSGRRKKQTHLAAF